MYLRIKYIANPHNVVKVTPKKNNHTDFLLGFIIATEPQIKIPTPKKNTKYSVSVFANINAVKLANIKDAISGNIKF